MQELVSCFMILCAASLSPKQDVNLLLDPLLVVWGVGVGRLLVNQARQVSQLINELEELGDVVGDGGDVGVLPLQVLLVDLAHSLHAFVDRFIVRIGSGLRFCRRLDQ